ncbi:hypothetical protein pEpSNUABM09_17 [Erwinia phage pEp_SNUABM_09]|uniref:Minor capsid protein n=1 Tax=Erwinia phage pEp_SNUABM_09 TaxID=2601644 RepID=A0A5J6DB99_9CAUD|nr:hypothetical protein pEpSNUABM09_17 [Erwinia phage pEp_SNUABM_09]
MTNSVAFSEVTDEALTPAQKAARTRAANKAAKLAADGESA